MKQEIANYINNKLNELVKDARKTYSDTKHNCQVERGAIIKRLEKTIKLPKGLNLNITAKEEFDRFYRYDNRQFNAENKILAQLSLDKSIKSLDALDALIVEESNVLIEYYNTQTILLKKDLSLLKRRVSSYLRKVR